MAASRFTTTFFLAMRSAPRDSVTVMIIGSSSGVRPTASATANRKDSSTGRPKREVHQEDEKHQEDGQPQDQQAQSMNAALEGARRLART